MSTVPPPPPNQTNIDINTIPGVAELESLRPTTTLGRVGQALGIAALVFVGIWLNNATHNPPNVVVNPPNPAPAPAPQPGPNPAPEPSPVVLEPNPPGSPITPLSFDSPPAPGPLLKLSDGQTVKLGRRKPVKRFKGVHLRNFLSLAAAGPPPDSVDYTPKAKASLSRMYANDRYGDCAIAGFGHMVGVWTGNADGTPAVATDAEIVNSYAVICGPGDNGCILTDVLDTAASQGLTLGGRKYKLDSYIGVDYTDPTLTKWAIDVFGVTYVGVNLPAAWQTANTWDVVRSPIIGGHAIALCAYNRTGPIASSWGRLYQMSWAALATYGEEQYAPLSPNWVSTINTSHLSPSGLDMAGLQTALDDLKAGRTPTIPPVPPPAPVPNPAPPPVNPVPTPTPQPKPGPAPQPTPAPPIAGQRIDLHLYHEGAAPAPPPPAPAPGSAPDELAKAVYDAAIARGVSPAQAKILADFVREAMTAVGEKKKAA